MKNVMKFLLSLFVVITIEFLFLFNAHSIERKDCNALVLLDCTENTSMKKAVREITEKGAE